VWARAYPGYSSPQRAVGEVAKEVMSERGDEPKRPCQEVESRAGTSLLAKEVTSCLCL